MSDAREWLNAAVVTDPATTVACQNALLAVLDECDRIMDGIDTPYQRSEITAYMHSGMAVSVNRMRAVIDAALGVGDE